MNIFDTYTREVLDAFNQSNVEYLVVGGYAVNFHGFNRTTGDIDLWIKPDNNNKLKIIHAFKLLHIEQSVLNELLAMDFTKHIFFSDGEPPYKIDFFTYVYGVEFNEAYEQKIVSELDRLYVPFINFHHLVITKFNTGRPQDKIDIDELQKIHALKNKK